MVAPFGPTCWRPLLLLLLLVVRQLRALVSPGHCERIVVAVCRDMPYNHTRLPNMIGDHDQRSVAASMRDFGPLIDIKCSAHLKFFLCSVFTPMCTEAMDEPITSCRSVCEEVERSCAPPLASFGIQWPALLNCSQFPVENSEPPCMDPSPGAHSAGSGAWPSHPAATAAAAEEAPGALGCRSKFSLTGAASAHKTCSLHCQQHWILSAEQKAHLQVWMTCWALACLLGAALTLIAFLVDRARFAYPKRPLVHMAFCQLLNGLSHLLPPVVGPEKVACQALAGGRPVYAAHSLANAWCVLNFVLHYYSCQASVLCWLTLTFTWYLATARKWSQESIGRLSGTFHALAWAAPALLTVVVLVKNEVEASELTSLCFLCLSSPSTLYVFYVGPLSFVLLVGVALMALGMRSMLVISRHMRSRVCHAELHKLRRLMTKMLVFSTFYIVATCASIACSVYEKLNVDRWNALATTSSTNLTGGLGAVEPMALLRKRPAAEICMLRIATSMSVGLACSMWACSGNAWQSWRSVFKGHFWSSDRSKQPPPPPIVQYAPASPSRRPPADGCYPTQQPSRNYHFPKSQDGGVRLN